MGRPGDLEHVEVVTLLDRYERISQAAGKAMGYHVIAPVAEAVLEKVRAGYTFLAFSTDFLFLGDACRGEVESFRDGLTRQEGESG